MNHGDIRTGEGHANICLSLRLREVPEASVMSSVGRKYRMPRAAAVREIFTPCKIARVASRTGSDREICGPNPGDEIQNCRRRKT